MKEFLMPAEAAKFLDVCKQTLYNWHKKKRLVPDKIHPVTKRRHYSMKQLTKFKDMYDDPTHRWDIGL